MYNVHSNTVSIITYKYVINIQQLLQFPLRVVNLCVNSCVLIARLYWSLVVSSIKHTELIICNMCVENVFTVSIVEI